VAVGSQAHPIDGQITTLGDHSYGVLAQSIGGGGNGGMSIAGTVSVKGGGAFSFGGKGAGGGSASSATLWSNSEVFTLGNNSHGLFAQSVGGGGGSGGAAIAASLSGGQALDLAFGGSAADGGSAGDVSLTSHGDYVMTDGAKSYGILAQSIGGGGGDGGFAVAGSISGGSSLNFGMGGKGGAGSQAGNVFVDNSSHLTTFGSDSHALFAQSVGGGGGSGGFSVAGSISMSNAVQAGIGGSGAAGAIAGSVQVRNSASAIDTFNSHAYGILAQSVGGGGGDGGFAVAGGIAKSNSASLSVGGPGAAGGDALWVDVSSSSEITTRGVDSHGIFAQSLGGGGGSGGFAVSGVVSTDKALSAAIGGNAGSAAIRSSMGCSSLS
jgi:hypothetical protein